MSVHTFVPICSGFQFLNSNPLNINTYDSNIASIQTSAGGAIQTYIPEAVTAPFTQFLSGQSYIVRVKTPFTITTDRNPVPVSYNFSMMVPTGSSIFTIPLGFCFQIPCSTYNSSISRVERVSDNGAALWTYRPTAKLNMLNYIRAGETYRVFASNSFVISNNCPTPSPSPSPSPTPTPSPSPSPSQSPTPTPSPTESPTPTPSPTESPTPTPSPSPSSSPTPTPSVTPLSLSVDPIDSPTYVDSEYAMIYFSINPYAIAPGDMDTLYYFNEATFDPTETPGMGMVIYIGGVPRADVYFGSCRLGTFFGYSVTGTYPFLVGVFTEGDVYFS